jgi:hypothetical protein
MKPCAAREASLCSDLTLLQQSSLNTKWAAYGAETN